MKSLILMRHAKSDWSQPGQSDREHVLNPRGRRAAVLIGTWLADEGLVPDAAVISNAERTRETWERLVSALPSAPHAEYRHDLYLCEPETLLKAIRAASDCDRLLVLGHNPGMAEAMARFSDKPRNIDAPTAATAVYTLPIASWNEAGFGMGRLIAFQTPKALV